jgi:hypothetical protein
MKDPVTLDLKVDMQQEIAAFVVGVKVTGKRRALLRLWVACALLGWAEKVLGGTVDLQITTAD